MLANVARPCSTAATMVAKSSSSRTRSAASRATSVPERAHGDADVGLLQGRAVVDAVAGHGDDVAAGLQRPGDAQLVLRGDPGDDDAVAVEQRAEDARRRRAGPRRSRTGPSGSRQPDLGGDGAARWRGGRR